MDRSDTFGLPNCKACGGSGKIGKRLHAGCYEITMCKACGGRGVSDRIKPEVIDG